MDKNDIKCIRYEFIFDTDDHFQYEVDIDPNTLEHAAPLQAAPDWCKLENEKCAHCPLSQTVTEYCPLARRIAPVLELPNHPAYEKVQLKVHKGNVTIESLTTVQEAYQSLIGLIMATSGCPHTGFFKPMAWFHVPFSSQDETLFRACATFLLFQFFDPVGPENENHFSDLKQIYQDVHRVNIHIAKRLKQASASQSTLNALTVLDIFAQSFLPTLNESLQELEFLFKPSVGEISFGG